MPLSLRKMDARPSVKGNNTNFSKDSFMASANDMQAAKQTYDGFIGLIKWSVPILALIALFVVYLIA